MRRATAIVVAGLALGGQAHAQSRYSLRGWGEAALSSRAAARALGGAEAAASRATVSGNPANLSRSEATAFYGTYVTEWVRTEEETDAGRRIRQDYTGTISNICLVWPMGPVAFGTGFLVGRRAGGTIEQPATTSTGESYRQILEADGNLLRIPALLATSWRGLEAGAGLDVLLLNAKRRWRNDFTNVEGFVSSSDEVRRSQWGVAWRAGLRAPLGRRLHVGGWFAVPHELSGTRNFENDDVSSGLEPTESDVTAEVASTAAIGFELRLFSRLRVVGDWTREFWKDVAAAEAPGEFVDVDRIAGGVEWSSGIGGPRWPVRLGYRTENLHTLDTGGLEVREHFVSAGSGFSVGEGRGEIDWFLEYGHRGDSAKNDFFEEVWRVGVTLTGSETWSRRRPPEGETEDW